MTPYEYMMAVKTEAQALLAERARVDHLRVEFCERRSFAYWTAAFSLAGERGDCNHSSYIHAERGADIASAAKAVKKGILRDIAYDANARERVTAERAARDAKELAEAVHWQTIPERFSQAHIWTIGDCLVAIDDLEDETAYLFEDANIESWRADPDARVIVGHACWTKHLRETFKDDPFEQASEQIANVCPCFDDDAEADYLIHHLAVAWSAYNDALPTDEGACWYEASSQAVYMLAREILALVDEDAGRAA